MNRILKSTASVAAAFALAIPAQAQAQDDMGTLLEMLVRNGYLSEAQAAEVAQSKAKPPVGVQPRSGNVRELRLKGMVQSQFGFSRGENAAGENEDYSTFEMRRVRIGAEGRILPDVRFVVDALLLPGRAEGEFLYLQWTKYDEAKILLGLERPMFGYEIFTASGTLVTVERSLISNRFFPSLPDSALGTLPGVQLNGKWQRYEYGLGLYNEKFDTNPVGSSRLAWSASAGLHLDDLMPEGWGLRFRADTMQKGNERGDFTGRQPWNEPLEQAYSISNNLLIHKLDVRTEYLWGETFQGGKIDGFYVMPIYSFTPKVQAVARYERGSADFARGLPAPNRYAGRTFAGRAGDEYEAVYLGANYYVRGNDLKFMFGVEFSELEDTRSELADTSAAGDLQAATIYGAVRMQF